MKVICIDENFHLPRKSSFDSSRKVFQNACNLNPVPWIRLVPHFRSCQIFFEENFYLRRPFTCSNFKRFLNGKPSCIKNFLFYKFEIFRVVTSVALERRVYHSPCLNDGHLLAALRTLENCFRNFRSDFARPSHHSINHNKFSYMFSSEISNPDFPEFWEIEEPYPQF